MRFRLGLVTGFAAGYYLGSRAGRQRYDQINRSLAKVRRSETFEEVTERAKAVAEEAVEKVQETVDQLVGDKADKTVDQQTGADSTADRGVGSATNGQGAESETQTASGIILPTDPTAGSGYSSSR